MKKGGCCEDGECTCGKEEKCQCDDCDDCKKDDCACGEEGNCDCNGCEDCKTAK